MTISSIPGFPSRISLHSGLTSQDRKSTRLNSSHSQISYAVFCLKKKNKKFAIEHVPSDTDPLPHVALVVVDLERPCLHASVALLNLISLLLARSSAVLLIAR